MLDESKLIQLKGRLLDEVKTTKTEEEKGIKQELIGDINLLIQDYKHLQGKEVDERGFPGYYYKNIINNRLPGLEAKIKPYLK